MESIRSDGITLFGNGARLPEESRLSGSKIGSRPVNFPPRSSEFGTRFSDGFADLPRTPFHTLQKEAARKWRRTAERSANWLRRKIGRGSSGSSKKFLASVASLRKYSKALP